jgi:hypothetical protein
MRETCSLYANHTSLPLSINLHARDFIRPQEVENTSRTVNKSIHMVTIEKCLQSVHGPHHYVQALLHSFEAYACTYDIKKTFVTGDTTFSVFTCPLPADEADQHQQDSDMLQHG